MEHILTILVSVNKTVVRGRLKFKTGGRSNGQNERDWAILVSLVSYEKKKNMLAHLKRYEMGEIRRSNDFRPTVPGCY